MGVILEDRKDCRTKGLLQNGGAIFDALYEFNKSQKVKKRQGRRETKSIGMIQLQNQVILYDL
jgi:hypothetical protein